MPLMLPRLHTKLGIVQAPPVPLLPECPTTVQLIFLFIKKHKLFVVSENQTCQFVEDLDEAALDGPMVLDIEVSNFENNPHLVLLSIHRLLTPLQSRTPSLDVADIAEQIVNRVCEIVNGLWNMGSLCQKLFVSIEAELNYYCSEREYVEYLSAREYERSNYGMVPAKGSSIKALQTVVFGLEEGGNCTICFEDFWVGEKVKIMPCEHFYHIKCIEKWLKNSHYCPICRYKMPTE